MQFLLELEAKPWFARHMIDDFAKAVEDSRDALIEITRDLVRFPTINPPGEAYTPCAEYLGTILAKRGYQVEYIRGHGSPGDTDRYPRTNMVARKEGRSAGQTVHFNGHIDVVEVGDGWTLDPFEGVVRDGKIYGRGTCDMKGGIAAAIIAADAFVRVRPDFTGAIEISGTVDEESGGFGGVAYLAHKGFFSKPRIDHVIIPEPLNKDRICLGHRGVWWAEIETFGRIAHGSMPFLGDSAIRHMGAILEGFEQKLFPKLAQKHTIMPVVPEGAKQSTLNINAIHGGGAEGFDGLPSPNVAHSCRMVIDRRFLIEEPLAEVKAEVIDILETIKQNRDNFRYSIRDIMEVLPMFTDKDKAVVRAVEAGIRHVFGREPEYVVSPGTYDQKHICRIGHLDECIAYGPGILDLAHCPDEYIGIEDMIQAATVMACGIDALLMGPK